MSNECSARFARFDELQQRQAVTTRQDSMQLAQREEKQLASDSAAAQAGTTLDLQALDLRVRELGTDVKALSKQVTEVANTNSTLRTRLNVYMGDMTDMSIRITKLTAALHQLCDSLESHIHLTRANSLDYTTEVQARLLTFSQELLQVSTDLGPIRGLPTPRPTVAASSSSSAPLDPTKARTIPNKWLPINCFCMPGGAAAPCQ